MAVSEPASLSPRLAHWRGQFDLIWPGLLLSAVIALASVFIAEGRGGPTLHYVLLLGMALNSIATAGRARPGVDFTARRILRLGVLLAVRMIDSEQALDC